MNIVLFIAVCIFAIYVAVIWQQERNAEYWRRTSKAEADKTLKYLSETGQLDDPEYWEGLADEQDELAKEERQLADQAEQQAVFFRQKAEQTEARMRNAAIPESIA